MRSESHRDATIARFVASRLIKFFGNASKVFSYLFYFVRPKKRFLIPACAKPLLPRPSAQPIPKVVWQTNYTNAVTFAVYLNHLFNRLMAPTYEFRFVSTPERARFIEKAFPGRVCEAYSRLRIGAAQADLWRVLVLQQHGGVYLDIDAHVVWPLELIVRPEHEELYVVDRQGALGNHFMASVQDNPRLARVIDAIVASIEENAINDVYTVTGPAVLNRALAGVDVPKAFYRQACYQGTFTNEFFQYVDHPDRKWHRAQKSIKVVGP